MAALMVPKPSTMMMVSDSSSEGTASSTSTRRISASSVRPPVAPASRPISVPTARPTPTATKAPDSECTAPCTTRAHRSRPSASVPSQCAAPGASSCWPAWPAIGFWWANQPGASAHSAATAITSQARASVGGRRFRGCRRAGKAKLRRGAAGAGARDGAGSAVGMGVGVAGAAWASRAGERALGTAVFMAGSPRNGAGADQAAGTAGPRRG